MPFVVPKQHLVAHELCFAYHDLILSILRAGEEANVFGINVSFENDTEREHFENFDGDVIEWLVTSGRDAAEHELLRRVAFHGLLSDFCHYIYEALSCSARGKLTVCYTLLRKPLQEVLFLFEALVARPDDFVAILKEAPHDLRSQKYGGVEPHTKHIDKVLEELGQASRFDAAYLAQLRYDKVAHDSFDASWNKAMHLFTDHKALRTEQMNINFIFSGEVQIQTQWAFVYSRLPYVLAYAWEVVEHLVGRFVPKQDDYLAGVRTRCAAGLMLWDARVVEHYREARLMNLTSHARQRLIDQDVRLPLDDDQLWEVFTTGRTAPPARSPWANAASRKWRTWSRTGSAALQAAIAEVRSRRKR